ncbi:MAG: hypothetical protein ACLFUI_11025, partial [Halanaerobiales bacterium]
MIKMKDINVQKKRLILMVKSIEKEQNCSTNWGIYFALPTRGVLKMDKIFLKNLKKNLPEIPGILGKEEHYFNSAVLISLVEIEGEYHFLFE